MRIYRCSVFLLVLTLCVGILCLEPCYAGRRRGRVGKRQANGKPIKKSVKVDDADTNGVALVVDDADDPDYAGTGIVIPPSGLISPKDGQPLQKARISLSQYPDKSKVKFLDRYPLDGAPVGVMWKAKLGKGILNLPAKVTLRATDNEVGVAGAADVGQMVVAGYHRRMRHWVYLPAPDLNGRDVPNNMATGELGGLTSDVSCFILVQPRAHHAANLTAAHADLNNPNSECLFCHYDHQSPANLDCIFCHGDHTGEVSLNKKFLTFHYVMIATNKGLSKLKPGVVVNDDCRVCHTDSVDVSPEGSAAGLRINVDRDAQCANCHGRAPVGDAPQFYQK